MKISEMVKKLIVFLLLNILFVACSQKLQPIHSTEPYTYFTVTQCMSNGNWSEDDMDARVFDTFDQCDYWTFRMNKIKWNGNYSCHTICLIMGDKKDLKKEKHE